MSWRRATTLWYCGRAGLCRPLTLGGCCSLRGMTTQPLVLGGHGIRLEPLTESHRDALVAAASDGRLWELWFVAVPPPEGMRTYVADALQGQRDGHMLPWIVRDVPSGDIIGSTRYHDTRPAIDRLEIGHTWYGRSRQSPPVNHKFKVVLLGPAFDTLGW